jgi:hypothetical protein
MQLVREEAAASMHIAQETMKHFYDRKRGKDPGYKPGDELYLSGKNLTTHRPVKKLDNKRHGPFKVVRKIGSLSYELKLLDTWKVHPVFNTVFLELWVPPVAEHQKAVPLPPPDVIDGECTTRVYGTISTGKATRRRSTFENPDITWWVLRTL